MSAFQVLRRCFAPERPERAIPLISVLGTAVLAFAVGRILPAVLASRRSRSTPAISGPGRSRAAAGTAAYGELPEGARSLISGMLDFSADPGSKALRGQLANARELHEQGRAGESNALLIDVPHPETLQRAVPHRQVFPVRAEFADPDTGAPRLVRLAIDAGVLSQLSIAEDPQRLPHAPSPEQTSSAPKAASRRLWPARWPSLADVTFTVESEAPSDTRAARLVRTDRSLSEGEHSTT